MVARPGRVVMHQVAHGGADGRDAQFNAFHATMGRQNDTAVGMLDAVAREIAQAGEPGEDRVKQARFGVPGEDALAEAAQHRGMEAGIAERQVQRVFPGDVEGDIERRRAVGQILQRLKDADKGQQHRRQCRLAVVGIQVSEFLVVELVKQHIANETVDRSFIKHRADQRRGIGRDRHGRLWFEAHGAPRGG